MIHKDPRRTELCEFTVGVKAEAARSLKLLHAIESTLAWLNRLSTTLAANTCFALNVNDNLDKADCLIDEDEKLAQEMESAQALMEEVYQELIIKRQHALDDHNLTDEDGIAEAYTEAIAAAADLHNAINTLRWNIGEHDVDVAHACDQPGPTLSTPKELEDYLAAL